MTTEETGASTVLVVDDEPFNVDLLTQELEHLGLRAISAGNGRQALELLDAKRCDIVLLDIMMPEMDGIEVLERLHETGRLASLPVIVISAVDDVERVARCIELGAEDHLLKPFDPILLRARIDGALEKKRLRDQVERQLSVTREIFGRYVPETVAASILAGEGTLVPLQTEATILYCDIEGFTGIVEQMPPVRTMQMLNEYFAAVLDPIRRHRGVVNQFQGDAMLVTFNVPVPDPRHADHAPFTSEASAAAGRSSRSIAPPCHGTSWRASCSVTRRARSLERPAAERAASSWPTGVPCSSTRWASCRSRLRPSC